jgi:hypothetical protein
MRHLSLAVGLQQRGQVFVANALHTLALHNLDSLLQRGNLARSEFLPALEVGLLQGAQGYQFPFVLYIFILVCCGRLQIACGFCLQLLGLWRCLLLV